MKQITKNSKGFSLIEILIAMVVLSVGLLGLVSMSGSVIKGNSLTGNSTMAVVLAQDKLEELINLDFSDLQLTDDGDSTDLTDTAAPDHIDADPTVVGSAITNVPIDPAGGTANAGSIYTRFWNIGDSSGTLKTIAVTIVWTDQFGSHTVTVTTIKKA